jgi:hypothetical protein
MAPAFHLDGNAPTLCMGLSLALRQGDEIIWPNTISFGLEVLAPKMLGGNQLQTATQGSLGRWPRWHRPVANPVKAFLDTRAQRINGETKHRMTLEMQEADTGYHRCLNAGKATFRGGYLEGKPPISKDSALRSPCPNTIG